MTNLQRMKDMITRGETPVGICVSFCDCSITELLADCGFDFLWIDNEHASLHREDTLHHIMAARGTNTAVFVRVPTVDPVLVKPILEMGVEGIIFPFVKTADEARLAVASCTYPPEGIRGYGPRRAVKYGLISPTEYRQEVPDNVWKIMQIEHVEAVRNLDEILSVDGVDAIIVGPMDLSGSIGLLGQTTHPEVMRLMDQIGEIAVKHKKPFGASIGYNPTAIAQWIERGVNWIQVESDVSLLLRGGMTVLSDTRKLFEK